MNPELIKAFEDATLNIREFDHAKHLYIAWAYLTVMPMQEALEKYCEHLVTLLTKTGYLYKYSYPITESYFIKLDAVMKQFPNSTFEQIAEKLNPK